MLQTITSVVHNAKGPASAFISSSILLFSCNSCSSCASVTTKSGVLSVVGHTSLPRSTTSISTALRILPLELIQSDAARVILATNVLVEARIWRAAVETTLRDVGSMWPRGPAYAVGRGVDIVWCYSDVRPGSRSGVVRFSSARVNIVGRSNTGRLAETLASIQLCRFRPLL